MNQIGLGKIANDYNFLKICNNFNVVNLPRARARPLTIDDFPDPFGPMTTFRVGPGFISTSEYCMKSRRKRRTMLPCWNLLFFLDVAIA